MSVKKTLCVHTIYMSVIHVPLGPTAIQYNNPLLQQEKLPEPSMMNSFSPYHSIIHNLEQSKN